MKKNIHRIIITILVFISPNLLLATFNKDSVLKVIKVSNHDSILIKAYTELLLEETDQFNREASYYHNQIKKLLNRNSGNSWFSGSNSVARTFNILGNYEYVYNRPANATNYYLKALSIYEKDNPDQNKSSIYTIRICVANIYMRMLNLEMVKFYCAPLKQELGLKNFDSLSSDYQMVLIACNNLLAGVHSKEKNHHQAIAILNDNLKLFNRAKEVSPVKYRFICITNILLSSSYLELNQNDKAIKYALKAYSEVRLRKFSEYFAATPGYVGRAYLKAGNMKLAERYLLEFDSLIDVTNSTLKHSNISALVELYEKLNKPEKVIYYLKKQIVLKDSAYAYNLRQNITETKEKYETEKRKLQLLKLQNQSRIEKLELEKQKNYSNYVSIISIAIATIAFGLLITIFLMTRNFAKMKRQKEVISEQKRLVEKKKKVIEQALIEKKILIKEIHHRVKNNLTIIVGLLEIQSFSIEEETAKQLFANASDRIRTIAEIHHQLYANDELSRIDLQKFVSNLVNQLNKLFNSSLVDINFEINQMYFNVNTASSIGLIINELCTNSFKHAVQISKKLNIEVKISNTGAEGYYRLTYKDNGKGIEGDVKENINKSMGLRLIKLLSKQLGGDLHYSYNNGSIFAIEFREAEMTPIIL